MEVLTIAKGKDMLVNEQIKAREVLVIGPNGEQLGVKSLNDALTLANAAGFDLVQMGGKDDQPVCKLMDYNKYKYERNKKAKEASKKQRINNAETKEFRLSVNIDVHDFNTKVNQVVKYLEKGHKIKVTVRFRGREMAHTELGVEVLNRFSEAVKEMAIVEKAPVMEGRNMFMMLSPIKKEGN
ncbi:MAG: translation initiation factor IF-3 [Bacilli bacterium]|nr:translation initiation factor IF-3 [Bacilli bacterium]